VPRHPHRIVRLASHARTQHPAITACHTPRMRGDFGAAQLVVDPARRPLSALRVQGGLIGCVLVVIAVSGCGGRTTVKTPSQAVQRDVAGRFAAALLRGDAADARALLVPGDDGSRVALVQQAVAASGAQQASIRLPARRAGRRWTFSYAGRRTYGDGRFERQRGDLVVFIAPSAAGAGVEFFAFRNVDTRFNTHHDSQLLPSRR